MIVLRIDVVVVVVVGQRGFRGRAGGQRGGQSNGFQSRGGGGLVNIFIIINLITFLT